MTGSSVAAVQVILLAVVLATSGGAKLSAAASTVGNLTTGPAALVAPRRHRMVTAWLGVVETAVAVALLVSPLMATRWAAVGLMVGALGVTYYLKRVRPEVGCGCFGALSTAPVSWLTLTRTALLLLLTVAALLAPRRAGLDLLSALPVGALAVLGVEIVALVAISLEFWDWIRRSRPASAADRAELVVPCEVRRVRPAESLHALHASRQWRTHSNLLISGVAVDVWREGCWRFYVYDGRAPEGRVQVAFAVHLEGRPPQVKAAVVAAADLDTILSGAEQTSSSAAEVP